MKYLFFSLLIITSRLYAMDPRVSSYEGLKNLIMRYCNGDDLKKPSGMKCDQSWCNVTISIDGQPGQVNFNKKGQLLIELPSSCPHNFFVCFPGSFSRRGLRVKEIDGTTIKMHEIIIKSDETGKCVLVRARSGTAIGLFIENLSQKGTFPTEENHPILPSKIRIDKMLEDVSPEGDRSIILQGQEGRGFFDVLLQESRDWGLITEFKRIKSGISFNTADKGFIRIEAPTGSPAKELLDRIGIPKQEEMS